MKRFLLTFAFSTFALLGFIHKGNADDRLWLIVKELCLNSDFNPSNSIKKLDNTEFLKNINVEKVFVTENYGDSNIIFIILQNGSVNLNVVDGSRLKQEPSCIFDYSTKQDLLMPTKDNLFKADKLKIVELRETLNKLDGSTFEESGFVQHESFYLQYQFNVIHNKNLQNQFLKDQHIELMLFKMKH